MTNKQRLEQAYDAVRYSEIQRQVAEDKYNTAVAELKELIINDNTASLVAEYGDVTLSEYYNSVVASQDNLEDLNKILTKIQGYINKEVDRIVRICSDN